MTIFLGADHRGFQLKEYLKTYLTESGYTVVDCGNTVLDPNDDYPDFAFAVAKKVVEDLNNRGIVICGSGAGVSIAVNKIDGIRASLAVTPEQVIDARSDDDINVIALASDYLTEPQAKAIALKFLETPFNPQERFVRRIGKITTQEHEV
ncbi:MAG: RpiB/LacA/LacB family sugar-phosphate isomerase [Candidatus Gottesmanbacteria bacterium]